MTFTSETTIGPGSVQSYGATLTFDAPEETEEIGCRFTGGGVDTDLNWDHTLEDGETIRNGAGNLPPGIDRYQFGGQVGARTAQDPEQAPGKGRAQRRIRQPHQPWRHIERSRGNTHC